MSWEHEIFLTSFIFSGALFHETCLCQSLNFFLISFIFFLLYLSQNVCEGPFKFKENEVRHFFGAESNFRPSRGALMTEQQQKKTLFPHTKCEHPA